MRNVIRPFDAFGERSSMIQRIVLIGLLLVPATAAVLLVAAKSAPAAVQSSNESVRVPGKKTSGISADPLMLPSEATAPTQTSAGTSIDLSTTQTSPSAPPMVDLRVNDQPVPVPSDTNVHKVIQQGNTTTTLDISNSSTTQGSSQSSTSTNINVNSSSESVTADDGP